jgi:Dolichyl-phosphate-mannose-protein mannosyltransferase
LQYTSFDYLWWVLVAYFVICLLTSNDARWWVAIGAAAGVGLMTKYTMAFLVAGLVAGVLLTSTRRCLRSPWLWCGAAVAVLVWLPNLVWQIQHHFVSLEFLKSIHARDVGLGRANGFLLAQLWKCTNPVTVPLWGGGLWYLFTMPAGRRYRMLGWMYIVPLLALLAARGRDYYLASAYPMLLAAGAVWGEQWLTALSARTALAARQTTWWTIAIAGLAAAAVTLPLAAVNSVWWRVADAMNGNFNLEIGYPGMVETVAKIRSSLPLSQQSTLGILAGDVGEAGAFNLYGPAYGLPTAIGGMNSNWLRGYGDPPPEAVIVVGMPRDFLDRSFASCEPVGKLTNRYGIANSAIDGYDEVFLCRHLRQPWPDFWKRFQYYG